MIHAHDGVYEAPRDSRATTMQPLLPLTTKTSAAASRSGQAAGCSSAG